MRVKTRGRYLTTIESCDTTPIRLHFVYRSSFCRCSSSERVTTKATISWLDLLNRHPRGRAAAKLGYGGSACSRADTHYPPRAGLSSTARCTSTRATRRPWKRPAPDTMTDYATDCLSHERRDSVIYLIADVIAEFRPISADKFALNVSWNVTYFGNSVFYPWKLLLPFIR